MSCETIDLGGLGMHDAVSTSPRSKRQRQGSASDKQGAKANEENDSRQTNQGSDADLMMVLTSNEDALLHAQQQMFFENLLTHSILRGFFDVPAIFSLRRVCRSFHRIIGSDSIVWSRLTMRWGGLPSTPWLRRAHPCLSQLAFFRDRCYLERIVSLKQPVRSTFNDQYRCTVRKVGFTPRGFFLDFKAEGDMSSGPLQSPWRSLMDVVVNGIIQSRKRPDRVELTRNAAQSCFEGYLFFDNVPFERLCFDAQIHFSYGSTGYSSEIICELTRLFCRNNRLLHLRRPSR